MTTQLERQPELKVIELTTAKLMRASVFEISQDLDRLTQTIQEQNPGISAYGLYFLIAEASPKYIPEDVKDKALQAASSLHPDTRQAGEKAFIFLNIRTVLSTVDSFLDEDSDQNRDDMTQAAIVSLIEAIPKMRQNQAPLSVLVYRAARRGVVQYLAEQNSIPIRMVRSRLVRTLIRYEASQRLASLSNDYVDSLAREIVSLIPHKSLGLNTVKLFLQNSIYIPFDDEDIGQYPKSDEDNNPWLIFYKKSMREAIEQALATLSTRQKRALQLVFGLDDGDRMTQEEAGREMGVVNQRISQLQKRALERLKAKKTRESLRDYVYDNE